MTKHTIIFGNSQNMKELEANSVDLIVTSPPYPYISMWRKLFCSISPMIEQQYDTNPSKAFEMMHNELDKVWLQCADFLKEGGYMCINIGDAACTIDGHLQLFDNHARIAMFLNQIGLAELPPIIWRKRTNAPNKFMGSGMLPPNAFNTSEHEYILIFRKGGKRTFSEEQRAIRRESAFFYEERNIWFSDTWELQGARQSICSPNRDRSAAYPLEIPYRLINMYSIKGDTVLDPFGGLQTTSKAAMLLGRNSVGYELDKGLEPLIKTNIETVPTLNPIIHARLQKHMEFVKDRDCKYYNTNLDCKVVTNYETDIMLQTIKSIREVEGKNLEYEVDYEPLKTNISTETNCIKNEEIDKTNNE